MNEIPKISSRGTDWNNFLVVIFAGTSNFSPFLSLQSVVTDDRKQFKCLNVVLNNKSRSLFLEFNWYVACAREQALLGALAAGREKEGELATTSLKLEYLHQKSRCEMLIGEDCINNDVITLGASFHMFFNVCLHSRSFPLLAVWRKSDSSVDGKPQGNWRRNSNSRDVVVSSPCFSRPAARAPRRACSQANWHEKRF